MHGVSELLGKKISAEFKKDSEAPMRARRPAWAPSAKSRFEEEMSQNLPGVHSFAFTVIDLVDAFPGVEWPMAGALRPLADWQADTVHWLQEQERQLASLLDEFEDEHTRFVLLRGGSHYDITATSPRPPIWQEKEDSSKSGRFLREE